MRCGTRCGWNENLVLRFLKYTIRIAFYTSWTQWMCICVHSLFASEATSLFDFRPPELGKFTAAASEISVLNRGVSAATGTGVRALY